MNIDVDELIHQFANLIYLLHIIDVSEARMMGKDPQKIEESFESALKAYIMKA